MKLKWSKQIKSFSEKCGVSPKAYWKKLNLNVSTIQIERFSEKPYFQQFTSTRCSNSSQFSYVLVSYSKNCKTIEIRRKSKFYCFGSGNPNYRSRTMKRFVKNGKIFSKIALLCNIMSQGLC